MLRPLFALSLCLMLLPLAGQSDSSGYRRLQLGVVGGQSYSEVDFTPNRDVHTRPGRTFGVALRYFDKQLVGFQAELAYEDAGWLEDLDGGGEYERRTDYAELQILTQFSFGRGYFQPLLQAGPFVSVPLGETIVLPPEYDPEDYPDNAYYEVELDKRVNYGLRAGLGFNLEFGPVTLQAEGRYLQGFSNLIRPGTRNISTSIRRAFGAHLGVFYAL